MTIRIGIAGVWHETNTFVRGTTTLADFHAFRHASDRESMIRAFEGTRTEIGGALDACRELGLRAEPLFFAAAVPAGVVDAEARAVLWDELLARLEAAMPLDALLLVLHGAMVCADLENPESDLIERARRVIGEPLIAVTLDLHANPGDGLLERADVVVGYDTYPHVDVWERGREAVRLLARRLEDGRTGHVAWRRLPLLTCPLGQATDEEPMAGLLGLAHDWERRDGIDIVSLLPGYPYADVDRLGFRVVACGPSREAIEACVDRLAAAVWVRRHRFSRELLSPEEAVLRALRAGEWPVVLADVADNVGGGAPGDGTVLLHALLEAAAVKAVVVLFDPEAAGQAAAAGEGATVELEVGGKVDGYQGAPVPLAGRIVRVLPDVRYRRSGSYMTGQEVGMGLCAVVESDGVEVVLTSRRVVPFDPDHLPAVGIDPGERRILVTKSAIAWRAAFGDIARLQLYVDTPGACTCRLERLPYTRLTRPVFPLDPQTRLGGDP